MPRVDLFTHEKHRILGLPITKMRSEGEHVLVERFKRSFLEEEWGRKTKWKGRGEKIS